MARTFAVQNDRLEARLEHIAPKCQREVGLYPLCFPANCHRRHAPSNAFSLGERPRGPTARLPAFRHRIEMVASQMAFAIGKWNENTGW